MIRKIYMTEQQEEAIEELVIATVEESVCKALFRRFRTNSFAGILRKDYKAAIVFLARWAAPGDIAEMITFDRGIMI